MAISNIIYAIKGGIPSVGQHSANPSFHLLCYNFDSNIGYIEKKGKSSWGLYTRSENLLEQYRAEKEEKFYYCGDSFKNCVDKLEEITGRIIKVLTTDEVMKIKEKA